MFQILLKMEHFCAHIFYCTIIPFESIFFADFQTKPNLHDRRVTVSQEKTPHLCRLIKKTFKCENFHFFLIDVTKFRLYLAQKTTLAYDKA